MWNSYPRFVKWVKSLWKNLILNWYIVHQFKCVMANYVRQSNGDRHGTKQKYTHSCRKTSVILLARIRKSHTNLIEMSRAKSLSSTNKIITKKLNKTKNHDEFGWKFLLGIFLSQGKFHPNNGTGKWIFLRNHRHHKDEQCFMNDHDEYLDMAISIITK